VDDLERVQVGDGLQHLPDDVAGVPLRVVALVQDPVEDLPTGGPARPGCQDPPQRGDPQPDPPRPSNLQLQEDEILLAGDVDVHQLQDVGVLHPTERRGHG